jgi:hypothetical protein
MLGSRLNFTYSETMNMRVDKAIKYYEIAKEMER